MKTLKFFLIIASIAFFSCDSNDDEVTPDPIDPTMTSDGFTYHQNNASPTFYETSNAYIEIDVDDNDAYPNVPDYYTFFFLDGRMYDNDADVNGTNSEYLFSKNTSNFVFLQVEVAAHTSLQTGIPPSAGNTYVVSNQDSVVVTGFTVDSSSPQTFFNIGGSNIEFGEANENSGITHLPASLGHSVTINAINIDTVTPSNSTIDVDYTFVNTSGELISGHYEGTLGIIED